MAQPVLGLVCFRLKGQCDNTQQLLDRISERKNIYMIPAKCHGKLMIRFVVCGLNPNEHDIEYAWNEITSQADLILGANQSKHELATHFANNVDVYNNSTDKTQTI